MEQKGVDSKNVNSMYDAYNQLSTLLWKVGDFKNSLTQCSLAVDLSR